MRVAKLVYFRGCARIDEARALLKRAGVNFVEIRQEALPETHFLKRYSSPTLVIGEEVIFGTQIPEGSSACSTELPKLTDLKQRIKILT